MSTFREKRFRAQIEDFGMVYKVYIPNGGYSDESTGYALWKAPEGYCVQEGSCPVEVHNCLDNALFSFLQAIGEWEEGPAYKKTEKETPKEV